jgi:hypothetical protein
VHLVGFCYKNDKRHVVWASTSIIYEHNWNTNDESLAELSILSNCGEHFNAISMLFQCYFNVISMLFQCYFNVISMLFLFDFE